MVNAIGGSFHSVQAYGGNSSSILDAQLAKYQVQLADWTNCPSCTTPEGKAKIAEIADKISDIKLSMQSAELSKPETRSLSGTSTPIEAALNTTGVGSLISIYA